MKPDILSDPVIKHARTDYVVLDENTSVSEAVKTMRDRGVTSVLVSKGGKAVGIVTERDVLYRVVAEGKDPKKVKLGEVKSSPLITISPDRKVSDAIAIMSQRGIRRIVVTEGERVLGVLTTVALAGELVEKSLLPELEEEKGITCPYCGSTFRDAKELSKHIDRVHISEMLRGETGKW
ncbi:MAG: CBS domain-containing protein [Thaumarchaeota archaeon]|nr:CBS domain-containing protein [Candidatus Calditenuaceae archaeon]MDW8041747.1 CBS domain-containing protein [Nitrososphaerota archaeon]